MIIVLYIFLGLCAFYIGLPVALAIYQKSMESLENFWICREKKKRDEEILRHLEQCKTCKFGGWIYDKERPTGEDARYHNGATYGVCCEYKKKAPFDSTFKADPGEKCEHYEKKEAAGK